MLELLAVMFRSRELDRTEVELVQQGKAFFHVSGSGHEATAALNRFLTPADYLHLHYRDKALMLARGVAEEQFLHALLCTTHSHSRGRQMCAHMSNEARRVASIVGPVGNNALQAAGIAAQVHEDPTRPIVVCALGDGSTQQGEVHEAIGEAARSGLRVLFLIEDNGYAISTPTDGRTFYDSPDGPAQSHLGVPIRRADGTDPFDCDRTFAEEVARIRSTGRPGIVVLRVERLASHTNADDQQVYRSTEEVDRAWREGDPIQRLASQAVVRGLLAPGEADEIAAAATRDVATSVARVLDAQGSQGRSDAPTPAPLATALASRHPDVRPAQVPAGSLLEALRTTLERHLASDPNVTLSGQDIEDPKGDVFGLTKGLSTLFPDRVVNSALSESSIVGTAVGRALAGGRPVACVQFADFLPLAFNQLVNELATIEWRTAGTWRAPVIVMAPCGGYRPGLGPFHAQTYDSVLAHIPGLDILVPSNAEDAAGLLNDAFASGRPSVLLYPKAALNDRGKGAQVNQLSARIPPGVARRVQAGDDLTLVSWGACVPICEEAVSRLAAAGVSVDLLDLRTLSPWDRHGVAESTTRTGRLVVVHEDSRSGGFGAEVVAEIVEMLDDQPDVRRVTRPDEHIPCNFDDQLAALPSLEGVLRAAAELLHLEVEVDVGRDHRNALTAFPVRAIGSSPADQRVSVVEWLVAEGDTIGEGTPIAECEADKAVFELRSSAAGTIHDLIPPGEEVAVGEPIARIEGTSRTSETGASRPTVTVRGRPAREQRPSVDERKHVAEAVGILATGCAAGGRVVSSEEVAKRFPGTSADDIVRRTGIHERPVVGPGEDLLGLAQRAAEQALGNAAIAARELDALIVSTSTPPYLSPSLACLLLERLCGDEVGIPGHDVLAACTGYLYALAGAHDICRLDPGARVLVVTAEQTSRFLDPDDFDTSILFGDAATATVVGGATHEKATVAALSRPRLATKPDGGRALRHGESGVGALQMDGKRVFATAVREMARVLHAACQHEGWEIDDLDVVIPHQANARIIEAVARRAGLPTERVVDVTGTWGNTSSSSIPAALHDRLCGYDSSTRVGLVAFGAGLTSGAATLRVKEA